MPDLTSIYTSPKVLFWIAALGLYGTFEGVGRLVRSVPATWQGWRNQLRNKAHDTDFYFAYRESGYIIMPGGTEYVSSRRERIVALKRLEEVPFTYSWSGIGTIREELFPDSYTLGESPRTAGQKNVRKRIKFAEPLEKGKQAEYTVLLSLKQTGAPPEPYLSTRSPHRVDELLMRVVFPANLMPDQVVYIRRNADGIDVHRETIRERDRLTGEFRKLIRHAEPHVEHVIEWTSPKTPHEVTS